MERTFSDAKRNLLSLAASRPPVLKISSLQVPRQVCGSRTPALHIPLGSPDKSSSRISLGNWLVNRAGPAGQNTFNLNQIAWESAYLSSCMWTLMVPKEEGESGIFMRQEVTETPPQYKTRSYRGYTNIKRVDSRETHKANKISPHIGR